MNFVKYLFVFLLLGNISIFAQETVDGSFEFQTDPAKKYSIYVPSSYDSNSANKLMLGFHPLNTNRWDGEAWRDTLIQFAETNDLLLVCPDGGPDGKIDDPIDVAFTTALLDSMAVWYNVDQSNKYIIGFSWGGRATYTYGLANYELFEGFIVIGAAVDGTQQINNLLPNATAKKFYLVHGSNDSPSVRFDPLVAALNGQEACVETNFLTGIGHTIDFPDRNNILTAAFNWVSDDSNCTTNSTSSISEHTVETKLAQNPISLGSNFMLIQQNEKEVKQLFVYDYSGRILKSYLANASNEYETTGLIQGQYVIKILFSDNSFGQSKLSIH